jgi:ATP-dependent DNA ligase
VSAPLRPPLPPMAAKTVEQLPIGTGWSYEPKFDGFRALAFRDRSVSGSRTWSRH